MTIFKNGVEMFCTASLHDFDMYDQVYIIKSRKKYILEIEERDYIEPIYDVEDDCDIRPAYVSRTVFDMIINGLKKRGFKRLRVCLE